MSSPSPSSSSDIIVIFIMSGCGYCERAKDMFKSEISSGSMQVQPSNSAKDEMKKAGLRPAFPTFKSMKTGKFHQGLPKSKSALMKSLGHIENYVGGGFNGVGGEFNGVGGGLIGVGGGRNTATSCGCSGGISVKERQQAYSAEYYNPGIFAWNKAGVM